MMLPQAITRALKASGSAGGDAAPKRSRVLAWLCVVLSLGLAGLALVLFEASLWRALLVAVLLACPVGIAVAYATGLRPLPFPIGDVPVTRGRDFNWIAPYYDTVCRLVGLGPAFRRRVVALAAIRPGEAVLDVGCGTGVLTRLAGDAAGRGGTVWGVDPAPDMIRIALIEAAKSGNAARFKPGIIEDLQFDAGSFDVVLISLVLHHLPTDLKLAGLKEAHRVLKPGGRLIVAGFFPHGDITDLLHSAEFERVVPAGRWLPGLTLWVAGKPVAGAGA